MEPKKAFMEKISLKAGVLIFLCYVLYFLLMKMLDLIHIPELRILNVVILFLGIMITFHTYQKQKERKLAFLEGILLGSTISTVSVVLFAAFVLIYFSHIDPQLLEVIRMDAPVMGQHLTPLSAAVTVMVEGAISGLIISFALMQFYKDDTIHQPHRKMSEVEKSSGEA